MPDQHTDAESKLRKLGERIRAGYAKQHPAPEQSLETVRGAVRQEWEREQAASRSQNAARSPKAPQRKPEDPAQGR